MSLKNSFLQHWDRWLLPLIVLAAFAAIGIPAYEDFRIRSGVADVFLTLARCEPHMAQQLAAHRRLLPGDATPSACGLPASTDHVSEFRVSGSRVEARLRDIHRDLDDRVLFIQAIPDQSIGAILAWRCGGEVPSSADKYLPESCRRDR